MGRIRFGIECLRPKNLKNKKISPSKFLHNTYIQYILKLNTSRNCTDMHRCALGSRGMSFARVQKVTWSPSARLTQCHQAAARLSPTRNAAAHSGRWWPPRSRSAGKLQLVHNLFSRVSMERQMSMQKFLMRNCDTFIVFTLRGHRSPVTRWWTTHWADRIEMCLFFCTCDCFEALTYSFIAPLSKEKVLRFNERILFCLCKCLGAISHLNNLHVAVGHARRVLPRY